MSTLLHQHPSRHAAHPVVGMFQGLHEVGGGEFFEVEVGLTAGGFGLVVLDDDAPDAPAFAIHTFGVGFSVLVAGILVAPVHDPEEAVGTGLGADGAEPAVIGAQEVASWLAFEVAPTGVSTSSWMELSWMFPMKA